MQLAIVRGHATTTVSHESFAGRKLLIVSHLDAQMQPTGDPMIVMDNLGAGKGQIVMLSSDGIGMREQLNSNTSPARWFTLGIVDTVSTKDINYQS